MLKRALKVIRAAASSVGAWRLTSNDEALTVGPETRDGMSSDRAAGGRIVPMPPDPDSVMVVLSPGEFYPACCPGLVIVDRDSHGLEMLMREHMQEHMRLDGRRARRNE